MGESLWYTQASTLATTAASQDFFKGLHFHCQRNVLSFLCSRYKNWERWRAKLTYWVFKGWTPGKVLPCSEKDGNFVSFAENTEHEVPFEIRMYRQLESALCCGCEDVFKGMITRSRQQMPFFVSYFSPFFLLGLITSYYIFHLSFFFFFLHSFLKYLDPLQVFSSMRSHVIWSMDAQVQSPTLQFIGP